MSCAAVPLRLHHRAACVAIKVGILVLTREGSLVGMRLTVRQTKNWKNAAMIVLELVHARGGGTETRLRLA